MKKLRRILFFLVLTSLLTLDACQKPLEGDPFVRFKDNFDARFGLECNGVSSVLACQRAGDTLTLTFEAPETLRGYVFTCAGGSSRLSFREVEIELTPELARIPNIISEILSASNDDITSISAERGDEGTLTRVETKNTGYIFYIFTSDGALRNAGGIILGTEVKLSVSEISFRTEAE